MLQTSRKAACGTQPPLCRVDDLPSIGNKESSLLARDQLVAACVKAMSTKRTPDNKQVFLIVFTQSVDLPRQIHSFNRRPEIRENAPKLDIRPLNQTETYRVLWSISNGNKVNVKICTRSPLPNFHLTEPKMKPGRSPKMKPGRSTMARPIPIAPIRRNDTPLDKHSFLPISLDLRQHNLPASTRSRLHAKHIITPPRPRSPPRRTRPNIRVLLQIVETALQSRDALCVVATGKFTYETYKSSSASTLKSAKVLDTYLASCWCEASLWQLQGVLGKWWS